MNLKLEILVLCFVSTSVLANQWKYTLAQEWPGSVCRTNKCTKQDIINFDGSGWNLHGVWPDKVDVQTCKTTLECTHEAYDPSGFSQSTMSDLDSKWVGLYNSVAVFREHEWTKHGTCWQGPSRHQTNNQQESYFLTALSLRKTYNLYEGLQRAGISPHDTNTHPIQSIVDALLTQIASSSTTNNISQGMIQIQCSKDPLTGKSMIFQVYLCLDENYQPMNCNCADTLKSFKGMGSCASEVLYPTFTRL